MDRKPLIFINDMTNFTLSKQQNTITANKSKYQHLLETISHQSLPNSNIKLTTANNRGSVKLLQSVFLDLSLLQLHAV